MPVTEDRDRGIRSFFWAHDNRHLLYVQDVGGDEDWHLFDVDLDTGDTRDLTPFEGVPPIFVANGSIVLDGWEQDDARRNRERVVRDAERENLLLEWDLGYDEDN